MELKNILDNGWIVCFMVKVNLYIKMVTFIKVFYIIYNKGEWKRGL